MVIRNISTGIRNEYWVIFLYTSIDRISVQFRMIFILARTIHFIKDLFHEWKSNLLVLWYFQKWNSLHMTSILFDDRNWLHYKFFFYWITWHSMSSLNASTSKWLSYCVSIFTPKYIPLDCNLCNKFVFPSGPWFPNWII